MELIRQEIHLAYEKANVCGTLPNTPRWLSRAFAKLMRFLLKTELKYQKTIQQIYNDYNRQAPKNRQNQPELTKELLAKRQAEIDALDMETVKVDFPNEDKIEIPEWVEDREGNKVPYPVSPDILAALWPFLKD